MLNRVSRALVQMRYYSPTPPKSAHPESEIKVVIEDEDEDTDFADFSEDGEDQEEEDFRASEQSERLKTNV